MKLMDGLGVVDFQPGNNTLVMLLSEADIIREEKFLLQKMKQLYKQKQELVKKQNVVAAIVFAKTPLTEQYLSKVEQLAVLEFSIPVIPLNDVNEEIGQVLRAAGDREQAGVEPFRE